MYFKSEFLIQVYTFILIIILNIICLSLNYFIKTDLFEDINYLWTKIKSISLVTKIISNYG